MRCSTGLWIAAALLSAAALPAAETKPLIAQGATKQEVIEALGQPIGHANFGRVEILHYRNGQVRLENGRVERHSLRPVAGSSATTAQAPATASVPAMAPAAPAAASAAASKEARGPLAEAWLTNFDDAVRDATRRNAPILALFTSSEATPASRQFQKEIVHHPEFVNAFRGQYVLLNIDSPAPNESTEAGSQAATLRSTLGVRSFPTLVILSDTGEKKAAVDVSDSVPGNAYRSRLISAVQATYQVPAAVPPPAAPAPQPVVAEPAVPLSASPHIHTAPPEVRAGLTSARWFVIGALCVGTLLSAAMLFVLWLVLRKLNKPVTGNRRSSMASRIDHAASGLPSHAEILGWPKDVLCGVIARLAELENFEADVQPKGSDKDLVLRRPGVSSPEAIVVCVTGNAGVIPTRRLREMVGMMTADDVASGWFVSPMGFSLDARAYAEEQSIRLIDGARLLTQLSDLPTFALPKVLASIR